MISSRLLLLVRFASLYSTTSQKTHIIYDIGPLYGNIQVALTHLMDSISTTEADEHQPPPQPHEVHLCGVRRLAWSLLAASRKTLRTFPACQDACPGNGVMVQIYFYISVSEQHSTGLSSCSWAKPPTVLPFLQAELAHILIPGHLYVPLSERDTTVLTSFIVSSAG